MTHKIIFFAFILCQFGQNVQSARILYITSIFSKSHVVIADALLKELALKGHEITKVSPFPMENPPDNVRDIYVPLQAELTDFMHTVSTEGIFHTVLNTGRFMHLLIGSSLDMMNDPQFQAIKNEKFDLLILGYFMVDFTLGLGVHFNCPTVILFSQGTWTLLDNHIENISPVAAVPHMALGNANPMTFMQRVANLAIVTFEHIFGVYLDHLQEKYYREAFPGERYPPFDAVRKNVSLVLLNQHFSQSFPRPYVPNMIEVGGLQIKEVPSKLPEVSMKNAFNFFLNAISTFLGFLRVCQNLILCLRR